MEQIYKKIRAIQELFGDREVLLPVTFKICGDNITADIKQFIIANEPAKKPEPETSKNDSREQLIRTMNKFVGDAENVLGSFGEKKLEGHTDLGCVAKENEDADEPQGKELDETVKSIETLPSVAKENDEEIPAQTSKWTDKLPPKFIVLAARYDGMNRFAYHTLHNEGGIIKTLRKNTLTGDLEEWPPYITVREYAQGSMDYLMRICNESNVLDKWRDFDVFRIAPGNWNSVVKETLITDPKAEESALTVVVYDIYMKSLKLVHFNDAELGAIREAIAKAEAEPMVRWSRK